MIYSTTYCRYFVFAVTLIMLVTAHVANAASPYTFNASTGAITHCDTATVGALVIPPAINGVSVVSIANGAFNSCTNLTSITIPSGVTSIGIAAFYNCSSLTGVTIPYGLTSIEEQVFRKCTSLTSVTIPSTVTSIKPNAFEECTSLTSIIIPPNVVSIGDYAFYNCKKLVSAAFSGDAPSAGINIFKDCDITFTVYFAKGAEKFTLPTWSGYKAEIPANSVAITTDVTSLYVPEGGTAGFKVKLKAQPESPITVTVGRTSGDSDISVSSGSRLTFTTANWNTYQDVTLSAAEDADTANSKTVITCSAGIAGKIIIAEEIDNDYILSVSNDGHGTTVPSGANTVKKDSDKPLSATPSSGYHFLRWSITSGTGTFGDENSASTTFTASEDAAIRADFAPDIAIVTDVSSLNVPEEGTAVFKVKLNAQPADSAVVTVTASGDADISVNSGAILTFTSGNWSLYQDVTLAAANDVDVVNGTATITCSLSGAPDKVVTATEIDNDYLLNVLNNGHGTTVPSGSTSIQNDSAAKIPIKATADNGYRFLGWTKAGSATIADAGAPETTVDLTGSATVTANFAQNLNLLEMANLGTGITSPSVGSVVNKAAYTLIPIVSTPGVNWHFVKWELISGLADFANANIKSTTVTLKGADGEKAVIRALFEHDKATLSMANDGNGTTTPEKGERTVDTATAIPISATVTTPDYHFVKWTVTGAARVANVNSADTTVSLTAKDSTVIVTANFAHDTALLTMAKVGGLNVTPASKTVNTATAIPISATAVNANYPFVNWTVTGGASVEDPSLPTTNATLKANGTVTANFIMPIANGAAIYTISGTAGTVKRYKTNIPACALFEVKSYGGTGDADLSISKDNKELKYASGSTNNETLQIEKPEAGDYIISLNANTAYSGLTLLAKYFTAKPLPPNGVASSKGAYSDAILVSWAASAGATSYLIYRSESKFIPADSIDETADLSYMDPKNPISDSGKTFNYWIKASNSAGDSFASAMASGCLSSKPLPPMSVSVTNSTYFDKVVVAWPKVAGATYYSVFRNTSKVFPGGAGINIPYDSTSATYTCNDMGNATAPIPNQTYFYWVKANNANGSSTEKISATVGTVRKTGPTSISASQGTLAEKIRVTWSAVPGATDYDLDIDNGTSTVSAITGLTSDYSPHDTAVHSFKARANLRNTTSDVLYYQSEPSAVCTGYAYKNEIKTLAAPVMKSASKGEGNYVKVTWGEVPLAISYNIYRDGAPIYGGGGLSYTDNDAGTNPGVTYKYCVTAVNGIESSKSASMSGYAAGKLSADVIADNTFSSLDLNGTAGDQKVYQVNIPSGVTRLVIKAESVDGSYDLYAKLGMYPTAASYNAKGAAVAGTKNKTLTVLNPAEGNWYVLLNITGAGYTSVKLNIDYYTSTDIIFTQVPANDQPVPFIASFKGRVLDRDGVGISGLNLQVRDPLTGLATWLASKTDAGGYFTYSALISGEGEYTYDFFFTGIPDFTKSTGSWTVKTKKSPSGIFDFSAYLAGARIVLSQTDSPGLADMQAYMNVRRGFAEGPAKSDAEDFWVGKTLGAAQSDPEITSKLNSGLYFLYYGTEGAAVGNGREANNPGLTANPLLVHVSSDPKVDIKGKTVRDTVLDNLKTNYLIDDAFKGNVDTGGMGVVVLTSVNNPDEDAELNYDISLYADQQLELLANLAGNVEGKVTVVDASHVNIVLGTKTIGVRIGRFSLAP